jgi:hypothetical protein
MPPTFARWCFQTDKGRWMSMGATVNKQLEKAFATRSTCQVRSQVSRNVYDIDLVGMTQKNTKTGTVRKLARHVVLSHALRLPAPSAAATAVSKVRGARSRAATGSFATSKKGNLYRVTPSMLSKKRAAAQRRADRQSEAHDAVVRAFGKIVDAPAFANATIDQQTALIAKLMPHAAPKKGPSRNLPEVKAAVSDLDAVRPKLKCLPRSFTTTERLALVRNLMRATLGMKPKW